MLLGLLIRIYNISTLPLYGDELTIVYDSYSLLKTGMDQTGEAFPLTFKMGAGRPPGYVYGSIPFVAMFGPSIWGVRSLSIISGLGMIILMYFLGKKIFNQKVGIIASFLTSISMWDIYLSRGGFEAHFGLFLATFGVVLFLYKKYIPVAFLWGLAIFTYPTFKLTIPLLFLALLFFSGVKKTVKYKQSLAGFTGKSFLVSIVILAIFAGFSINETYKGTSEERFLRMNTFSDLELKESIVQKVNNERYLSTLPEIIKPFFYNKPFSYSRILLDNYMENISLPFLYLRGDRNPRHNPGEWGMFYLIELPLLFAGLYFLKKNEKRKLSILISWILIVPLATMFLSQTHGLRNAFMLPPFILISAYVLSKLNKKMAITAVGLMIIQLIFVLSAVYFLAPAKFSNFWSKEAMIKSYLAIEKKDDFETVVLSTKIDNIEYAYPVYAKVDPQEVISQYNQFPKKYDNVVITDNTKSFNGGENILVINEY